EGHPPPRPRRAAEQVLPREELPQRGGYPGAEVTTEEGGGVHPGQERGLPGPALRASLHSQAGVGGGEEGGAAGRTLLSLQGGAAAEEGAPGGEVGVHDRVDPVVVPAQPETVQEDEEDAGGSRAQSRAAGPGLGSRSSHSPVRETAAR